jgi:uncharacterized protein (DUF2267 family)
MDEGILVGRVAELAGFHGRTDAARAIRATVIAIGERLRDDERAALGRALPGAFTTALERAAYAGDFEKSDLFARVARHGGVGPGFGAEHAQVVCQALGELLPAETLTRLRKELGPSIGELFLPPEPIPSIEREPSVTGSTLAAGRPGSRHPVSDAHVDLEGRPDPKVD